MIKMRHLHALKEIAGSPGFVFRTVWDVRNFRDAVSHITHVRFLSDRQYGVGTQFRKTRLMNGREQTGEIEVAELMESKSVRAICDTAGTIGDTSFTVSGTSPTVTLGMTMEL